LAKIIIDGWIEMPDEKRGDALALAAELFEPTREQPGCLDYAWTADPQNPSRVYVHECWATPESLQAHLDGPWYRKMFETMTGFGLTGMSVTKYEVAREGGVYGPDGPTAEFFE